MLSGQSDQGDLPLLETPHHLDVVTQAAAEPVQPPHHQAVAGSGALQRTLEARAVDQDAGGSVDEHPVDLSALECVEVQGLVLLVSGARASPRDAKHWVNEHRQVALGATAVHGRAHGHCERHCSKTSAQRQRLWARHPPRLRRG